jgi:hypothetical protein
MPRVATALDNTYDSITRPVAMAAARYICKLLSLPENIRIIMAGPAEEAPMPGSTLNHQGEASIFDSEEQITIEISEETTDDRVLSTPVYQVENVPFFIDRALGVKMKPVYSQSELVMQFTYYAPNRTRARKVRKDALLKSNQGRAENVHEIDYHYPVPVDFLRLLKHIHTLRESHGGYGESFDTWMKAHITDRATNLTNVIGKQRMLAIAEKQIRPIGYFDFSTQPQPEEKDKDNGRYVLKFEYRLVFDEVIGAVAEYPLVVHNQLIDNEWFGQRRASGDVLNPENRRGMAAYNRYAMDHIVRLNQCCTKKEGLSIPEFDEWQPTLTHPTTYTIANVMLQVDPENPYAVLNLETDLGDFKLNDTVIAFLKGEAAYLNRFAQSVIYLTLYRGDSPIEDGSLLVDRHLNVQTNRPMDIRDRYHLRIAVVADLNFVSSGAIERFRTSGQACLTILAAMQGHLLGEGYLPKLLGGKVVPLKDIKEIAHAVNNKRKRQNIGTYVMMTVGTFFITTHRSSDYASHGTQTGRNPGQGTRPDPSGRTPLPAADKPC